MFWFSVAFAQQTLQVPADYPRIQDALDVAAAGDIVQVAAGTYEEDLIPRTEVLLRGEGAHATTLTPITVGITLAGMDLTVEDLSIRGGAGGIDAQGPGRLTVNRVAITSQSATRGAGILAIAMDGVDLHQVVFKDNDASTTGGNVHVESTLAFTATDTIFNGGTASQGGAAYFLDTSVVLQRGFVVGAITVDGGAIQLQNDTLPASFLADGTQFRTNTGKSGDLDINALGDVHLLDTQHTDSGDVLDGAVMKGRTVTLERVHAEGAMPFKVTSDVAVLGSAFRNGRGPSGIASYGSTLTLSNNLFCNAGQDGVLNAATSYASPTFLVEQNLFTGHLGTAIRGEDAGGIDTAGNVVWNNGVGLSFTRTVPISARGTMWFGNGVTIQEPIPGTYPLPADETSTDPGYGLVDCATFQPLPVPPDVTRFLAGLTEGVHSPVGSDTDNDGYCDTWLCDSGRAFDCDDTSDAVFPAATEAPGDLLDSNCDGTDQCLIDADGDTYGSPFLVDDDILCSNHTIPRGGGDDCDDGNDGIFPGATEVAGDNVDQNCDGSEDCYADEDLDGYRATTVLSGGVNGDGDCNEVGESLSSAPVDCNDLDLTAQLLEPLFPDCDSDGTFDGSSVVACGQSDADAQTPCTDGQPPDGGWTDVAGTDCNDEDPSAIASTSYFPDCDGDGAYPPSSVLACGTSGADALTPCTDGQPPDGGWGTGAGADCNDEDGTAQANGNFFPDCDGDGVHGSASVNACGTAGADALTPCTDGQPPDGGWSTSAGADCNDEDDQATAVSAFFPDCDTDGTHASTSVNACGTAGADALSPCDDSAPPDGGWSPFAGADCNDEDGTAQSSDSYFADCDGDGEAVNGPTIACGLLGADALTPCDDLFAPDGGWQLNPGLDCDDEDPGINSSAYDIPGDTIDQDCDGDDAPLGDTSDTGTPGPGGDTAPTGDTGDTSPPDDTAPTGDTGPGFVPETCDFTPCGGDPTGRWRFTSSCPTTIGPCPHSPDLLTRQAVGTVQFGADGSTDFDFVWQVEVPAGCVDTPACEDLFPPGTSELVCTGTPATGCSCTEANQDQGTWGYDPVEPDWLAFEPDDGTRLERCVTGDEMTVFEVTEGELRLTMTREADCVFAYDDLDGDSFGDPATEVHLCGPLGPNQVLDNQDCDDSDPLAYPGAPERCNGLDDSCDGTPDGGLPLLDLYADCDGDGFSSNTAAQACGTATAVSPCLDGLDPDGGWGDVGADDCRDEDPAVNPGADDPSPDGTDQDCDGIDGPPGGCATYYADTDGDFYGDPDSGLSFCGAPEPGYLPDNTDCDDTRAAVHPDLPERCDGVDTNCDGTLVPGEDDADGDRFLGCTQDAPYLGPATPIGDDDCDDADPTVNPGVFVDPANDGVDQDCDGIELCFTDNDSDGVGGSLEPSPDLACIGFADDGGDCDDSDPSVFPGAAETALDGIDQDCDGVDACYVDTDDDGFGRGALAPCSAATTNNNDDCDDLDPSAYPGAFELCDGADNDCNGVVDDGFGRQPAWPDDDGDGYGDSTLAAILVCDAPPGSSTLGGDCDDADATTFPGAIDECGPDGDRNCDGMVLGCTDSDADGDGFCDSDVCSDATLLPGDCDDSNADVFPGQAERCDTVDNNCDGRIDEGLTIDQDGDGATAIASCFVTEVDCDDGNPEINPFTFERCNGIDDDCDGEVDDGLFVDLDGDGWGSASSCLAPGQRSDCDDRDATRYPFAPEPAGSTTDLNCDGLIGPPPVDQDFDGDGYCGVGGFDANRDGVCDATELDPSAVDCDDLARSVNPGAFELPGDGIDNNCDGTIDEATVGTLEDVDGDGYVWPDDCDELRASVHPGASDDNCDGLDTDCDGNLSADELDWDRDGFMICEGDCNDQDGAIYPGAREDCTNGIDDNCDDVVDGGTVVDADGDGRNVCDDGDCWDSPDAFPEGYDEAFAEGIYPGAVELCDGFDNDCDGLIDEGFDLDNDGFPDAEACGLAPYDGDCDDTLASTHPGAPEICGDGVDNDCAGDGDGGADDRDNDGWTVCEGDCNDYNPQNYPGGVELCGFGDNNCNGIIDEGWDPDGDGYQACQGDCDPTLAAIHPGAEEICGNEVDENCDTELDAYVDDGELVECPLDSGTTGTTGDTGTPTDTSLPGDTGPTGTLETGTPTTDPTPTETGTDPTTPTDPAKPPADEGCGCQSSAAVHPLWLLALLVPVLRRRAA